MAEFQRRPAHPKPPRPPVVPPEDKYVVMSGPFPGIQPTRPWPNPPGYEPPTEANLCDRFGNPWLTSGLKGIPFADLRSVARKEWRL